MAYVYPNMKTKKMLKESVKNGITVRVSENTPWGKKPIHDGTAVIEGPHYPEPHRWYANVTVKDGKVVKVR